jgi:hypothetical protein
MIARNLTRCFFFFLFFFFFCSSNNVFTLADISNTRITDKENEQVRLGGLRHPHLAGKAREMVEGFLRKVRDGLCGEDGLL